MKAYIYNHWFAVQMMRLFIIYGLFRNCLFEFDTLNCKPAAVGHYEYDMCLNGKRLMDDNVLWVADFSIRINAQETCRSNWDQCFVQESENPTFPITE